MSLAKGSALESPDRTKRRLIFLGTGTSVGVPMIGCECPVCRSDDPRNNRTRSSVLIQSPGGNLLIDTSPEMRIQLVRERISQVHAIAYTHHHVDHLFGLDDARLFPHGIGGPVPLFCEEEVEDTIRRVFHYAFEPSAAMVPSGGIPQLRFERIRPGEPFTVLGQRVIPLRLEHGRFRVLGFRIGDLAYCTDVSRIPEESWPILEGVRTFIVDALRPQPHPTHFHLDAALAAIERVGPDQAYLTHLSHSFDHGPTELGLPRRVALAYDGLTLNF